eukprot:5720000-Amphidinium_carterae.1
MAGQEVSPSMVGTVVVVSTTLARGMFAKTVAKARRLFGAMETRKGSIAEETSKLSTGRSWKPSVWLWLRLDLSATVKVRCQEGTRQAKGRYQDLERRLKLPFTPRHSI